MTRWMTIWLLVFALVGSMGKAQQKGQVLAMQPKIQESGSGVFHWEKAPKFFVGTALRKSEGFAYAPLQERLRTRFGEAATPEAAPEKLPQEPLILIGLTREHPALRGLEAQWKSKLPKEGLGDEGFLLEITPQQILLAAAKPAGIFYGVQELLARMGSDPKKSVDLPAVLIADWPTMKWRGMHVLVHGHANVPQMEALLTKRLPELRMNQLILEINYNFQYRSHPEVANADGLTLEDCRHLSDLAHKNFVRIIPMLNCLGHQSWAEHTDKLLTSHPEFDETPDYPADNKGIYCRSWCPSNPDVNKVVFALFDELIDAFHADAFHVGMDEVFILGQCSRCKGQSNADLFARAVNDLHAHLVGKRKVQMLMWGDRLIDNDVMKYGKWEASANGTAPAVDKIPKDIIIADWHYEKPADFPSVKFFQDKGFRVWPSGWNTEENATLLTTCALKNRTPKMVGYLATTWIGIDRVVAGLSGDETALAGERNGARLIAAIQKGAEIAWDGK